MSIANIPTGPDFQSWLWNQAPSIVFLAIALWVVGHLLVKQNAKFNQFQEDRFKDVEKRLDDCEQDRDDLRKQLMDLRRK
jgi:hypothetical protein